MKRYKLKPICLAIGFAFSGAASAASVDFSGTNFYMKFLDGNQRGAPNGSIDTASGGDQGQFTEMNLIFKSKISPQVEAGGRIQSRSSAAYWTEFGGFGQENAAGGYTNNEINHQKFMKLRGAYVELTPGYNWLNLARIGTNDWGMFDPFTVGKVRYIDRDNYNGLYFQGPMASGSTWEFARIYLPSYLQFNWGQGATCCSTDSTQYNEAVNIAQFKMPVGGAKVTASYQSFIDHMLYSAATFTGAETNVIYKNTVIALKADGSPTDSLDLRGAYYWSSSDPTGDIFGQSWGNTPAGYVSDKAIKLDADLTQTGVDNLTFNFEYFNIGAGYNSNVAARRESDVLLTEGSESAWYNWGNPIWSGGSYSNYSQLAATKPVVDNAYMDFDESPAESVVGWKGLTVVGKYDYADSPMSLELTHVGYNNNWQAGYAPSVPVSNFYAANQDRTTNIIAFKINHNLPVMGGLDLNFKFKKVSDKDKVVIADPTDDRNVFDKGASFSVGNQLFSQLYGTLSYGRYIRDITASSSNFNNSKSIYSLKLAYNLPGFEVGMLTQWIQGRGNPTETVGADTNIRQYRMKTYAQVNF